MTSNEIKNKLPPRKERLAWPDRHMLEAILTSYRSPDPNTQVGACIINQSNRVVATGYNSYPNGIRTCHYSWEREDCDPLKTKYPYVVHAEKNAIFNASGSIEGGTLYVTMFPCNECAKDLIQAGITKVVYLRDLYPNQWQVLAAKSMFQLLDIPTVKHKWQNKKVVLSCIQKMFNIIESST